MILLFTRGKGVVCTYKWFYWCMFEVLKIRPTLYKNKSRGPTRGELFITIKRNLENIHSRKLHHLLLQIIMYRRQKIFAGLASNTFYLHILYSTIVVNVYGEKNYIGIKVFLFSYKRKINEQVNLTTQIYFEHLRLFRHYTYLNS